MNFIPNWPMRGLCAAAGCRKLEASNPIAALPSAQSEVPELKVEAQELLLTPFPLRVIKNVETLRPELDGLRFAHGKGLEQPRVKIGAARHVEESRPESPNVRPVGWL
jgi:hypothetical protein